MEDILGSIAADCKSTWEKYTTGLQNETDMRTPEGMQASPLGVGREYLMHRQHISLFLKVYIIFIS